MFFFFVRSGIIIIIVIVITALLCCLHTATICPWLFVGFDNENKFVGPKNAEIGH